MQPGVVQRPYLKNDGSVGRDGAEGGGGGGGGCFGHHIPHLGETDNPVNKFEVICRSKDV